MRTTALNYTSETVTKWWHSASERRSDVQCEWDLTGQSRFLVSPFLSSFLSSYCSCLFLVPLFFLSFSSFLFLISSTHSFIQLFINPHIKLSFYLSIHPLTGESTTFFISSSLFLYFFRFLCSLYFILTYLCCPSSLFFSLFQFSNYSFPFPLFLFNFPINSTRGKLDKNISRLDL